MKKLILLTYVLFAAAQTIFAQQNQALPQRVTGDLIQAESGEEAREHFVTELDSLQNCTIIYAADDTTALAGNNEDYKSPFGTIWFLPAENGKFGRVYFGWKSNDRHFPQGGMNDQGLFFDGATAENVFVPRDSSKPAIKGQLILKAMEECSTL